MATKQDSIVVPPETCFLDPGDTPNGTVRNVYVQDVDKRAVVLHMDMPMDKRVRAIVRTVLKQLSPPRTILTTPKATLLPTRVTPTRIKPVQVR